MALQIFRYITLLILNRGRPVATMVEVMRLIDPNMMVEIEAEAVISD